MRKYCIRTLSSSYTFRDVVGEYEWVAGVIDYDGHIFDVHFAVDDRVLVRPVRPYHSHEFETLFGFGCHCKGYCDKVVEILV